MRKGNELLAKREELQVKMLAAGRVKNDTQMNLYQAMINTIAWIVGEKDDTQ